MHYTGLHTLGLNNGWEKYEVLSDNHMLCRLTISTFYAFGAQYWI